MATLLGEKGKHCKGEATSRRQGVSEERKEAIEKLWNVKIVAQTLPGKKTQILLTHICTRRRIYVPGRIQHLNSFYMFLHAIFFAQIN